MQQAPVPGDTGAGPSGWDASLAAAHAELLKDKSLQFQMQGAPRPPDPPRWLDWLPDFFQAIGPVAKYLFWGVVILAVLLIAWLILREVMGLRLSFRRRAAARAHPADWAPDREKAAVLLADADRLAAEGRFEEAAHLVLLRGVEDIRARRPGVVAPALTSREIAASERLPERARPAFAEIARIVERSLFGGGRLDEPAWRDCRAAYERLVFADAWR